MSKSQIQITVTPEEGRRWRMAAAAKGLARVQDYIRAAVRAAINKETDR